MSSTMTATPRYGQKRPGNQNTAPGPARVRTQATTPTAQDRTKEADARRAQRAASELRREASKARSDLTDILCAALLKLAAHDERRKLVIADQVDAEIAADNAVAAERAELFEAMYVQTGRRVEFGLFDGSGFTASRMIKAGLAETINARLGLTGVGRVLAEEFAGVSAIVSFSCARLGAR